MIIITELAEGMSEEFFQYLEQHIAENGQEGNIVFLPLSKDQSTLSDALKEKFLEGMHKPYGENGWRKAWIATHANNQIIGHIDIRSHNQPNAEHRVLLGMGVHSQYRNHKIGQQLLQTVIDYCRNHPKIAWLDLEMMANNHPAKKLYEKMGFEIIGEVKDMFRIDQNTYDYTSMTLKV